MLVALLSLSFVQRLTFLKVPHSFEAVPECRAVWRVYDAPGSSQAHSHPKEELPNPRTRACAQTDGPGLGGWAGEPTQKKAVLKTRLILPGARV